MRREFVLGGFGVDHLTNGEGNHGGLSSTRLGLGNDVAPRQDGQNSPLLDGRRLLEPVRVNPPQNVVLDAHLLEGRYGLHPLRGLEGHPLLLHRDPPPIRRNHRSRSYRRHNYRLKSTPMFHGIGWPGR